MSNKDLMTDPKTQPNEKNRNQKIKYVGTREPINMLVERKIDDISYRSGEYSKGKQNKHEELDDEFDDNLNSVFDVKVEVEVDAIYKNQKSEKSKYINYSRESIGSKNRGTFSNSVGINTRDHRENISNKPIDRFHHTFRKYQDIHFASFPEPENTRTSNKKVMD